MEFYLSDEIKKIPFMMACEHLGLDEETSAKLMDIEKNRNLVEEGLNDLYYLLTLGVYEPNIFGKYCSMISQEGFHRTNKENFSKLNNDMAGYLKLVKFCFSPKIGKTLERMDEKEFASAAEEFALFGKLMPEDEEILHGNTLTVFTANSEDSQKIASNRTVIRKNPRRVGNPNVILLNQHQVLMPIFYNPVPVLLPFVPHFRPQQWPTRVDYRSMGKTVIIPPRPVRSQLSITATKELKQVLKIGDVAKDDSDEKKSE